MKTAYPIVSNPVTITLYANIPFDNTYKHHSLISSLFKYGNNYLYTGTQANVGIACERFLNRRNPRPSGSTLPKTYYYPRWTFTDTFNFHYSNGLICSVVMELTPAQTNANYMKVVSGTDTYYYFITAINQLNEDTYTLSLELDVFMTYQDEFLEGVKNVPIFTTRKHSHRFTNDGIMPYCADYKTGDDAFLGVKPSLINQKEELSLSGLLGNIEKVKWLYICCDIPDDYSQWFGTYNPVYKNHGKSYPLTMVAIPLNVNSVTYKKKDGTKVVTFTSDDIQNAVRKLIGKGDVHGAKISPYPPFTSVNSVSQTITLDGSNNLTIACDVVEDVFNDGRSLYLYKMTCGSSSLLYGITGGSGEGAESAYYLLFKCGGLIISEENANDYYYANDITPSALGFVNPTAPSILSDRYLDPKLLFSPFKKYTISSQYATNGWEFFPELIFSQYVTASNNELFKFFTTATSYIGDNNFYTSLDGSRNNQTAPFEKYRYDKIGLLSSVNYIFPCGTNALDVFNATQRQSFYTSKVASGITSGITMGGGIASIVLGAGMLSNPATATAGAGLIAGGTTAVASGTAGIATNIKSAQAKMEDLKNTPDSVNVTGSNYIIDECMTWKNGTSDNTNCLPYVLVYDVPDIIKKNADDYFYQYGYQVSRDCYFNTNLQVANTSNNFVDNNIFGRTIFNYVQINEDITNKIDANIPLIAKQKLSSILNNGITLWSFFGVSYFWSDNDNMTNTRDVKFWFMKNDRDNTEYKYS